MPFSRGVRFALTPWLPSEAAPRRVHVRYDSSMSDRRFDMLSSSESGLTYVREKRGGVMRVLTESELADFSDPPPCAQCAEQFGCEHFNCAGGAVLGGGV